MNFRENHFSVGIIMTDLHPPSDGDSQKEPTARLGVVCRSESVNDAPDVSARSLYHLVISGDQIRLEGVSQLVHGFHVQPLLREIPPHPMRYQAERDSVATRFRVCRSGSDGPFDRAIGGDAT